MYVQSIRFQNFLSKEPLIKLCDKTKFFITNTSLQSQKISYLAFERFKNRIRIPFLSSDPSTPKTYHLIKTSFLSLSLIGAIHALGLFAIGMTGTSFLIGTLSLACILGASMTEEISTKKTFSTISEELQTQVLGIKECNVELKAQNASLGEQISTLKKTNTDLQTSVDTLALEIAHLSLQREGYQKITEKAATDMSENNLSLKAEIQELKKQVTALETLEKKVFPKLTEVQRTSLEELKRIKELFEALADPLTVLKKLEEIESTSNELKTVTKQLQDTESSLSERLKELKIYHDLLLQHQEAHKEIIASYRKETAVFKDQNDRLSEMTKDLLLKSDASK